MSGQLLLLFLAAAVLTAGCVLALRPLLTRYALTRPNARSSHHTPTPQGGGIAVIVATTITVAGAVVLAPNDFDDLFHFAAVFASVIALAIVGVTDDIHPLEATPRLILQAFAVAIVLAALPAELHIVPLMPWWVERALLFVAMIWFVNLVNFMDGIDWMTVAEVIPVTAALAAFGLVGALPWTAASVAFALCGAMAAFAPFNRPVAQLFLGDVGSLPIGLLLGWLLILLAGGGHFAAALLLPLYYLADATVTLLRRCANGESIMTAHRSHFYQRAMDGGFTAYQIVTRVFAVNIALIGLAALTLLNHSLTIQLIALIAGTAIVTALLWNFSHTPQLRSRI